MKLKNSVERSIDEIIERAVEEALELTDDTEKKEPEPAKKSENLERTLSYYSQGTIDAAYEIAEIISAHNVPIAEMYEIIGLLKYIMVAKRAES